MSYIFKHVKRKVGFLVIDITWKLFSQTGNIETYLLMKELENDSKSHEVTQTANVENRPLNTKV